MTVGRPFRNYFYCFGSIFMTITVILTLLALSAGGAVGVFVPAATGLKFLWGALAAIGAEIVLFALFFLAAYVVSLCFPKDKRYDEQTKVTRFFLDQTLWILCFFGGVRISVNGAEKLPEGRFLIVYNHKSNFDPIILSVVFRKKDIVHISKPGNFDIPIAGGWIRRNCYLSMSRTDPKEALRTVMQAAEYVRSGKFTVGVAPEGTRNRGEGLLPFKNGCFKIALLAECPIAVCCLKKTEKIAKNFPLKRTRVELTVADVLPYETIKRMKTFEISDLVRSIMAAKLGLEEEKNDELSAV